MGLAYRGRARHPSAFLLVLDCELVSAMSEGARKVMYCHDLDRKQDYGRGSSRC